MRQETGEVMPSPDSEDTTKKGKKTKTLTERETRDACIEQARLHFKKEYEEPPRRQGLPTGLVGQLVYLLNWLANKFPKQWFTAAEILQILMNRRTRLAAKTPGTQAIISNLSRADDYLTRLHQRFVLRDRQLGYRASIDAVDAAVNGLAQPRQRLHCAIARYSDKSRVVVDHPEAFRAAQRAETNPEMKEALRELQEKVMQVELPMIKALNRPVVQNGLLLGPGAKKTES